MPGGLAGRETLGPNLMVIGPSSVRWRPPRAWCPKDQCHRLGPNGGVAVKVAKWPAKDLSRTHWFKAASLGPTTLVAHASLNRSAPQSTTAFSSSRRRRFGLKRQRSATRSGPARTHP